jgi:hypothetical protein
VNWWFVFWIGSLATYRITILFTRDKIGKPLRNSRFGTFFKCTYCVSVWIGFLVTTELYFSGFYAGIPMSILMSFSFSAIAIFADRTFSADYIT